MTLIGSCSFHGHIHRPRRVELTDAPTRADPTGTSRLRARMRAEGDRRWQVLARTLRQALIEHDLVGLRGMGRLPHGDKAEGFALWLREELRQKVFGLDGRWVRPYVAEAAAIAARRASEMAGGAVDPARVTSMGSVAVSELRGIIEAAQQQIVRTVTHCLMANATPTRTANAAAGVIKTMRNRTRAMSEYIVAKTHATSTLSAFRSAGVTHVGVIPERLRKKRPARLAAHGKVLDRDDLPAIVQAKVSVETESRWMARFAELERLYGHARALELLQREIAAEGRGLRTGAAEFGARLRAGTEEFVARRAEEGAAAKAARAARESFGLEPRAVAQALPRLEAEIAAEGARLKTAAAEFGARLRAGTEEYVARRAAEGAAAKAERLARTRPEEVAGIKGALEIGRAEKAKEKLEKAFGGAEAEVDVITAGDDDVCPECEDISDGGPYSLDEAEGLIPAHNYCRCSFAPAGQYEKDALRDYDPDQPRDPDGKFAGSGVQPALAGAGGPHSAESLHSRLGNFVKSGQAKAAIASAATKALGAAKAHQADLLGYAVTAGLYHVVGIDFPVEVEAAIHSEVEHLAQNLGVARSAAVAMMKDAVGRLQGLRARGF